MSFTAIPHTFLILVGRLIYNYFEQVKILAVYVCHFLINHVLTIVWISVINLPWRRISSFIEAGRACNFDDPLMYMKTVKLQIKLSYKLEKI